MPTWQIVAQLRLGGTHTLAANDRIWLSSGVNLTDNVVTGQYQDYTHVSDVNDAHVAACSNAAGHVNNTKRVNSTQDICKEGDEMLVKVIGIDRATGKIRLSRKETIGKTPDVVHNFRVAS